SNPRPPPIHAGETIFVFGDYDVDGVTSAALLTRHLTSLGGNVVARVPDRMRDGYGLSLRIVEEAAQAGATLLITADCGTGSIAEAMRARELGCDLIVADHHRPGPDLPPGAAVVNPWRADSVYPFPHLAAAGVVTKLLEGLWRHRRARGAKDPRLGPLLDLSAIGTIADNVPLTGENRALAFHGLARMRARPRPAIAALFRIAGVDFDRAGAGEIGYQIAPRLNAAGRIGSAKLALDLLLCDDPERCHRLAASLEGQNLLRKELLDQVLQEAGERAVLEESDGPLVLGSDRWHPGVLGIAAARLAERHGRPTILLGGEGERWRGSGRTVRGCDLHSLVLAASASLEAFGGHAAAVGLTLSRERLPEFRSQLAEAYRAGGHGGPVERSLTVDALADLHEVDRTLLDWLERMEPFGQGNPPPVVAVRGRTIGVKILKDRHVRFQVDDGRTRVDCIGFQLAGSHAWLSGCGSEVHVAGTPCRNVFRGEERLQFEVRDIVREDPFGER
ncbi:MAG: single-stranded-DNA-specific exonuclease RecJ, partial [Candidatus Eisenbacteria bacterium]|nr:single-stranded-DNA-specific exonuclease RecJ [Candidatus Eisenbacteria bacterium]